MTFIWAAMWSFVLAEWIYCFLVFQRIFSVFSCTWLGCLGNKMIWLGSRPSETPHRWHWTVLVGSFLANRTYTVEIALTGCSGKHISAWKEKWKNKAQLSLSKEHPWFGPVPLYFSSLPLPICNYLSGIFSIRSGYIRGNVLIRSCLIWEAFPFTQAQNIQACWQPAVIFAVWSSAASWLRHGRSEVTKQSAPRATSSLMSVWCVRPTEPPG